MNNVSGADAARARDVLGGLRGGAAGRAGGSRKGEEVLVFPKGANTLAIDAAAQHEMEV